MELMLFTVESYFYATEGRRVQKNSPSQRVNYLAGLEIRSAPGSNHIHIIMLRNACIYRLASTGCVVFSVADASQSLTLELDHHGKLYSRESYYPFGGTACWATRYGIPARYKIRRYAGKERDASGLVYYGFRYCAPWLMSWISADPATTVDGLNLFRMLRNNPLSLYDADGRWTGTLLATLNTGLNMCLGSILVTRFSPDTQRAQLSSISHSMLCAGIAMACDYVPDPVAPLIGMVSGLYGLCLATDILHNARHLEAANSDPLQPHDVRVLGTSQDSPAFAFRTRTHEGRTRLLVRCHGGIVGENRVGRPFIDGQFRYPDYLKNLIEQQVEYLPEIDDIILRVCFSAQGEEASLARQLSRAFLDKQVMGYGGKAWVDCPDYSSEYGIHQAVMESLASGCSLAQTNHLIVAAGWQKRFNADTQGEQQQCFKPGLKEHLEYLQNPVRPPPAARQHAACNML